MPRKKKILTEVTTEAATPRTTEQKLAAAKALVLKYEQQLVTESIVNNIEVNDPVSFNYGRTGIGEGPRVLSGVVTGIKDDESLGRMVAVLVGEGFDATTYKVRVKDITENKAAAERNAAAPEAGDPLSND